MKWLKMSECGISKWADVTETIDGGLKVCRIPDYWLDRVVRRVTPRANESSGIHLNFSTSSRYIVLEMMSEFSGSNIPVLSIWVDDTLHEYSLSPAPLRQRIELNFVRVEERCIKVILPINTVITLYEIGVDSDAWVTANNDNCKTICFVGDSITQGVRASKSITTYPYLVAEHLNTNYINLGMSGAGFPDPIMAIYLSAKLEWDYLSIAMGTNSFGGHESAEEYEIMYGAFLDIIRANKKHEPILCITPIWRGSADGEGKKSKRNVLLEEIREAIRNAVWTRQESDVNLYLLEGTALISSVHGLSHDCLHPDDTGMEMMSRGISEYFKENIMTQGDGSCVLATSSDS